MVGYKGGRGVAMNSRGLTVAWATTLFWSKICVVVLVQAHVQSVDFYDD